MSKVYEFTGDGAGVPGLPHVISEEEAEQLGLAGLLQAAIENGNYRERKAPQSAKKKRAVPAPEPATIEQEA